MQKITVACVDKKKNGFKARLTNLLRSQRMRRSHTGQPLPFSAKKLCETPDKVGRAGGKSHAHDLETGGGAEGF